MRKVRMLLRNKRSVEASLSASSQEIIASGLLDAEWYTRVYSDLNGVDPLHHYTSHGWKEGRSPGPIFDSQAYLTENSDVARAGMEPLTHYIRHGAEEHRNAWSAVKHDVNNAHHLGTRILLQATAPEEISLAVVIHVFYLDVFEQICQLLQGIPIKFSLLITTPKPELFGEIKRLSEKIDKASFIDIRICPNRGRNFGPMLTEFREIIPLHSILLHLHTKKSLFSGRDQSEWRWHMFNSLIASPYLINRIIDDFNHNESLGFVHPSTSNYLPYWAHTWLSNGHIGPDFLREMGANPDELPHYFDYPVGSMFWARTSALKPLWEKAWRYDDFPEELGQTDGTIQHVLERALITIARSRDFHSYEIDYEHGAKRVNSSGKNLSAYVFARRGHLKSRVDKVEVVSFDLFDTLVTRPALNPNSVQRYTDFILSNRLVRLEKYYSLRKAAELEARRLKSFQGDVNIDEIAAAFSRAGDWNDASILAAIELELSQDAQILTPRPDVVDILKYARSKNKRIILVSDTYLTSHRIKAILKAHSLLEYFDQIYLSSELGYRKDRGDMWDYVESQEGVNPSDLLHIGDNEQSDLQKAGDRRFETHHVMAPAVLMSLFGLGEKSEHQWETDILLGPLASRFGANPFRETSLRPLHLESAYDVGFFAYGPLVYGFITWLLNHPLIGRFKKLLFLSREGYFLLDAYRLVTSLAPDHTAPDADYLYVSRASTIGPALVVGAAPMLATRAGDFAGTLGDFMRSRLGCEPPHDFALSDDWINLPKDADEVERLLSLLAAPIGDALSGSLIALKAYLNSLGLDDPAVALADVGYSGTIQRALQFVTGRNLTGFYMATSKGAAAVVAEGGHPFGCFGEWIDHLHEAPPPLYAHQGLVEAFLTAPQGQTIGYEVNGDDVVVKLRPGRVSQEHFKILQEIQAGVRGYIVALFRDYGSDVIRLEADPVAMQEPLRMLAEGGATTPLEVRKALSLEDDFCGNGEIRIGLEQLYS